MQDCYYFFGKLFEEILNFYQFSAHVKVTMIMMMTKMAIKKQ